MSSVPCIDNGGRRDMKHWYWRNLCCDHNSERKFSFLKFLAFFFVWQPPFDLNLATLLYHIPHNFLMCSLWNISLNNAA